jgi:two-component system, NtrC family, C4-dicarboxylate transport sensor histidine kinase DctB
LAPINVHRNAFCVGKSYHEHAKEFSPSSFDSSAPKGELVPPAPVVSTQPAPTVIGDHARIVVFAPLAKRFGQRRLVHRRLMRYIWILLVIPAGVWCSYTYTERIGIETISNAAVHRCDLYENTLTSELARYHYLPSLLNLNPEIVRLLQEPDNVALTDRVNRYLAAVNRGAHSNTLYIMGLRGKALASSNWDQPYSFVGMNFAYRPYFQQALAKGDGSFYGLGTYSKEAGYFYAERIYAGDKLIGIATVKINLEKIENIWRRAADTALITDAHGVIFLSTFGNWRFKSLNTVSGDARAMIAATHQYDAPGALQAIGLIEQRPISNIATIAKFAPNADLGPHPPHFLASRFLLVSRPVSGTDWTISTLSDIKSAEVAAANVALGVGLGMALITVFVLYLFQRRRIIAQELLAKESLRRMNDELERKVARRTDELNQTNKTLKVEVAERRRAEAVLKSTLQELVQAGKMAALGQMSASITHELNQPLAALRTLSSNALTFMQRRELDNAQENLRVICDLTERMGKITSQLKRFARKSPSYLERVPVSSAISNALFLLDSRIRSSNVRLVREEPQTEVHAIAEPNRLEQVLVNLIGNALDAMLEVDHLEARVLTISVKSDADYVSISVRDTGSGISEQARAHLFEPFFTTKDQGEGLGLGLTISISIVREFGGTLVARSPIRGGAEFTIRLKEATLRVHDA